MNLPIWLFFYAIQRTNVLKRGMKNVDFEGLKINIAQRSNKR